MKRAVYYEEAKRLFVNEGFSLDVIVKLLKDNVSRKTLYNWKTENNWDEQRKQFLKTQQSLSDDILDITRTAIKEAKANPTPHNIYAVLKAINAFKLISDLPKDEPSEVEKKIKPETIEAIEHEILGL